MPARRETTDTSPALTVTARRVTADTITIDARFFCASVVFRDGGSDAQLRADDFPVPLP
jgi:hypothetical protein